MNSDSIDPQELDSSKHQNNPSISEPARDSLELDQQPVVAEIAGPENLHASQSTFSSEELQSNGAHPSEPQFDVSREYLQPPIASELRNLSAIGGAVGAVVLGVWSILCALITPFSAINAFLSLMLGAYGLSSPKRRLAMIGILLGIIGLAMSLSETNEILGNYFKEKAAS